MVNTSLPQSRFRESSYRKKRCNHGGTQHLFITENCADGTTGSFISLVKSSRSTSGNHGGSVGSTGLVMWIVLTIF